MCGPPPQATIRGRGALLRPGSLFIASRMPTIYRKTAKGVEEIQTRAWRLAPRLRSALILVDGQRADDELARMLPQAQEVLAQLAAGGFIELLAELASAPARAAPAPATAVPGGTADAKPRVRNFELVQREAVRRLNDLVGPDAETLAIRMERCNNLDTLRPLLVQARQMIAGLRGTKAADEYISALSAL